MKKIVSRQINKIALPAVVGGLLVGMATGHAAQPGSEPTTSDYLQTAISGDKGCVAGAREAQRPQSQQQPQPQKKCSTVGCVVKCD
jgi:hypothetical protein